MAEAEELTSTPAPRLVHSESWLEAIGPAFFRWAVTADRRPGTLKVYRWALDNLFASLRAQGVDDLALVKREHLEVWQYEMLQNGRRSSSSRSSASSAAKALIRWAAARDIVDWRLERAIVPVRVHKKQRQPIPVEDLEKILRYLLPRRPNRTLVELRDRALFVYLFVTTSRVTAALQVRRSDYIAPIVVQKGGDEITLDTTPTAIDLVYDYLRARRDDSPWLWIKHGNNLNATGDRLESSGVREAWTRLCLELQIKRFTTHQVRHTGATHLANDGLSPFAIQDRLKHLKLETTMGYIKVGEPLRRSVDESFEKLLRSASAPRSLPRQPRRRWSDYRGS